MRFQKLGKSDLEISRVVFGAMEMMPMATSDEVRADVVRAALDAGITTLDTAPLYEFGRSERVIGRALAGRRDGVVVATKVGLRWDVDHGDTLFEFPDEHGTMRAVRRCSRPESVRVEVDRSLERLGIAVLDLVQVHHWDRHTPIAETMGALADLVKEGKVRAVGVSNYSRDQIREAIRGLGDVPLTSVQPEYNLVKRFHEQDIFPLARAEGVGVIVYSPLEQGVLTGAYPDSRKLAASDGRNEHPSFHPKNRSAINAALDRAVKPVAARHGVGVVDVVLSFVLAQPGVTGVIVGARTPEQARANARAAEVDLAPEELASIRAAFEAVRIDPHVSMGRRKKAIALARRVLGRAKREALKRLGK